VGVILHGRTTFWRWLSGSFLTSGHKNKFPINGNSIHGKLAFPRQYEFDLFWLSQLGDRRKVLDVKGERPTKRADYWPNPIRPAVPAAAGAWGKRIDPP
jgi:hypothetical protein